MADYATLLRDQRDTHLPLGGPDLLAGLRAPAAERGHGGPVPALAARVPDSVVGGVREDRPGVCGGGAQVREGQRDPGALLRQGREEGGDRAAVHRGRGRRWQQRGGADRHGAGEGAGLAVLPAKGQRGLGHPHMEWGWQMVFINHFYFYLWDAEWGGAFWKTNAYAPWPVWIWLNGHEWAKRQLAKGRHRLHRPGQRVRLV